MSIPGITILVAMLVAVGCAIYSTFMSRKARKNLEEWRDEWEDW